MSTDTDASPVTRAGDPGAGASRAVFWTGIVLATAVTVTALWDGARPAIPGMPSLLGLAAGVVLMWLIVAGLGAGAAELLRRHHRALGAHAARHGRRAALATARGAGRGSRAAAGRAARWAGPRWERRKDPPPRAVPRSGSLSDPDVSVDDIVPGSGRLSDGGPLSSVTHHDHTLVLPGECPDCGGPGPGIPLVPGDRVRDLRTADGGLLAERATVVSTDGERVVAETPDGRRLNIPAVLPCAAVPDPRLNDAQRQRDANGQGNLCAACGNPGTPGNPLIIAGGYRIHRSHTTDPDDGFHDPAGAPAPAAPARDGEPMSGVWHDSPPTVPDAGTKTTAAPTANAPAGWKALAAVTADCEPEDDGNLLGWMAGEVAGMAAYGESLIEVYETCVNSVGLDPVAMAAVHDVADAAADAATAMAYARQKFASHYAEVREFVGNGGVLPFDGRWITGEGDT